MAACRAVVTAILVAISVAVAGCGSARVDAPVPRPFPAPSRIEIETVPEERPPSPAIGAVSEERPPWPAPWGGTDFRRYLAMVEDVETGGDCRARPAVGSAIGCYQMTRAALVDAGFKDAGGGWLDNAWGIDSDDEFRSNRAAQDAAMLRYTTNNWRQLEPCTRDLIGTTVGGVALDQAALVAGAHLLGATGLVRFVRCGLREQCISSEVAGGNGGNRRLRATAIRRMNAAYGLRVLESTAGSVSSCRL